jgi:hypothetical protein
LLLLCFYNINPWTSDAPRRARLARPRL